MNDILFFLILVLSLLALERALRNLKPLPTLVLSLGVYLGILVGYFCMFYRGGKTSPYKTTLVLFFLTGTYLFYGWKAWKEYKRSVSEK